MPDNSSRPSNSLGLVNSADFDTAKNYDQNRFASRRMKKLDEFERQFARYVYTLVGDDAAVLDVPCGNGRFYDIFSQAKHVTMADYSENMVKACRERYAIGTNVDLIQADITSLPLVDCSVDLSFCMRLFHHMKTDEIRLAAMKELARVSRKYVALSFYNSHCLRYFRKTLLGKKISGVYIPFMQLLKLADAAGLECVSRRPQLNIVEQQCMVVFKKK
ncbi:MAG: class I SAM-dependent methyltransferase [Phycisphaerae bacterium]|jgi:ubiquinone/menaquinone biosynthesis C-methylase UbiE|nr:class I SAM-dependent methyltransferase [Phycisphaerae bacterium]